MRQPDDLSACRRLLRGRVSGSGDRVGNLADQLVQCWREILLVKLHAKHQGLYGWQITEQCRSVVDKFDWRDGNGRPVTSLPWPVLMQVGVRKSVRTNGPREAQRWFRE